MGMNEQLSKEKIKSTVIRIAICIIYFTIMHWLQVSYASPNFKMTLPLAGLCAAGMCMLDGVYLVYERKLAKEIGASFLMTYIGCTLLVIYGFVSIMIG